MAAEFTKDPGDVLDYTFDWSQWLSPGETISNSTWYTSGPGITVNRDIVNDTSTTVWLSGGANTAIYYVKNQIVTTQFRTVERTMTITIIAKGF